MSLFLLSTFLVIGLAFPFEGLPAPSLLLLLVFPHAFAFVGFDSRWRVQHLAAKWIEVPQLEQHFSLSGLDLESVESLCPRNVGTIDLVEIFPFSPSFGALLMIGITTSFLVKLTAIELAAKKTNSKVGGLLEGRLNILALTKSLSSESRILYQQLIA